jgi:hypothetical protein
MKHFTKRWPLVLLLSICGNWSFAQQNSNQPKPCSSAEARQFDFWLGEWEVHAGGKLAGKNKISSASGGCALLEEYEGASGYQGKSLNFYDTSTGKWQQVWVGSAGDILFLAGEYKDGKMMLQGESMQGGKKVMDRITWHNNTAEGTVRQVWEKSSDEGKTWKTVFDGLYKKKQ